MAVDDESPAEIRSPSDMDDIVAVNDESPTAIGSPTNMDDVAFLT